MVEALGHLQILTMNITVFVPWFSRSLANGTYLALRAISIASIKFPSAFNVRQSFISNHYRISFLTVSKNVLNLRCLTLSIRPLNPLRHPSSSCRLPNLLQIHPLLN